MVLTIEEIKYINIAKAFAILAMVLGHAASPLNPIIYQYHMALFIFISGYLYKDVYSRNPIKLIKRRIKTLYLPFLKYELIIIILNNFLYFLNISNEKYIYNEKLLSHIIKGFITFNSPAPLLGSFWFLKTLFLATITFGLISYIIFKTNFRNNEYTRLIAIIVCYIMGNLILHKYGNTSHQNFIKIFMTVPIFYFGYLFHKFEDKIPFNVCLGCITLMIICLNSFFGSVDIANNHYTNAAFYLVSSLCGIYFNIYIAKMIAKKLKASFLVYIGKNTMIILALHIISFKIVDILFKQQYGNLNKLNFGWLILSFVGIVFPIGIKFLLDKITNIFLNRNKKITANV